MNWLENISSKLYEITLCNPNISWKVFHVKKNADVENIPHDGDVTCSD